MKKIALSVVAIVGMSSFVFAGGDIVPVTEPSGEVVVESPSAFYVGLGIAAVSATGNTLSENIFDEKNGQERLGNVTLLAGYDYNEYVAFEGRYTTSFAREDIVEMNGWSLFVKPQYPVSEEFSVYALLGFGGVTMDGINGSAVDVDDTGFQWGLGVSYDVYDNMVLFADYTSLANDMDGIFWGGELAADADAFTVGLNYKF